MTNSQQFQGETKESIADVKEDIREIKIKVEKMDIRIWIILLALVALLGDKAGTVTGLIGHVLAWGK